MPVYVEVFGPGCAKCEESAKVAAKFLADRRIPGEVVKFKDVNSMASRGILRTPTVLIDEERVVEGRVLRESDLDAWLRRHPEAAR
ncbi:MAG: thioredoxin family protein [Planctomycetes bacterium]|nr:thioredoxin family protein [Planctomycetota bacterium]